MKNENSLSQTENEIMEVLWQKEHLETGLTPSSLLQYFEEKGLHSWKKQTISTYLSSLKEKDLVFPQKQGREVCYFAKVSKTQFHTKQGKNMLETLYDGSLKHFMSALFQEKHLSKEDITDLKLWLEEQKELY